MYRLELALVEEQEFVPMGAQITGCSWREEGTVSECHRVPHLIHLDFPVVLCRAVIKW